MRHFFQPQWRLAHLADAVAQGLDMLGAQIGVMREPGLELVDWLGGDSGGKDLEEPLEGVVEALQSPDALLYAEPGLGGRGMSRDAGERREVLVGLVGGGGDHCGTRGRDNRGIVPRCRK